MELFRSVLAVLQVFGYLPVSREFITREKGWCPTRNIWMIIWTLMGVSFVGFEIYLAAVSEVFWNMRGLELSIEIIKMVTTMLAHLLAVSEACFTVEKQTNIWLIKRKIEALPIGFKEDSKRLCGIISRRFVILFFTTLACEIYYIVSVSEHTLHMKLWAISIFSTVAIRVRYLHHILYTTMLSRWYCHMKNELRKLATEAKINDDKKQSRLLLKENNMAKDQKILDKLQTLKRLHSLLYEMSLNLNGCFGASQLVCLLDNFIELTCHFYWVYALLANQHFDLLPDVVLAMVPTIIILVALLTSCEGCLMEGRYVGFYVHEIERDSVNYDFDLVVENFSLQILNEPLEFAVAGFFSMNFNLLQQIFAAITTNMVILIQFTPRINDFNEEI